MPAGSVELIFADPPYNIGIDYGDGAAADRLPDSEFIRWCGQWIDLCVKALSPNGSFWLLIGDEYADIIGCDLRRSGLHRRAWIKWYETFGVCNSTGSNFSRCSRHLFYCVKNPRKFTWNPDAVNRPSDRQTKYNDSRANPGGKVWDDVWQIPRLVGTATERIPDFPTQLPLELLTPIVLCSSNPGDLVVDPFNGSATTGVAAIANGRRYIGIEKQNHFHKLATMRLKGVGH
jgi:site-specific DNA-methyltransferase (adenine-specific)